MADNDLDAELLALAGDGSDYEPAPAKELSPPASAYPAATQQVSTPTKASRIRSSGSTARRRKSEDDEGASVSEDGEMDESVEEPISESEDELFPIENKFKSEKDRAEVLALPEIKREEVLAERASQLERRQQDKILKRLYQGYNKAEQGKGGIRKRRADSDEAEDTPRKSTRQKLTLGGRKVGEESDAIKAYKETRERRGKQAEQRKAQLAERKARRARGSETPESERDASAESDVDYAIPTRDEPAPRKDLPTLPADLKDFNRVHVGRINLAQFCFYHNFEESIRDCYVRVSIGNNKSGQPTYRMAKVKSVTEGKPYALELTNGKRILTTQHVLAVIGKSEREVPFQFCSMTKFVQEEFDQYTDAMKEAKLNMPTKAFLQNKIDDINRLINTSFNEEQLQAKFKKSSVLIQRHKEKERASLIERKEEAEKNGNTAALTQIEISLRALEEAPKLAYGTTMQKSSTTAPVGKTQQERLAEINAANKKANIIDVRKALQAEQRARRELQQAIERGEAVTDRFARVKVLPKTRFDANKLATVEEAKTATPAPANGAVEAAPEAEIAQVDGADSQPEKFDYAALMSKTGSRGEPKFNGNGAVQNGTPKKSVFKQKLRDDEVLASLDMDIDADIEVF